MANAVNLCTVSHLRSAIGQGSMESMHEKINSSRKAYAAPRLKLYGSVQALTAAGTGMMNEMNTFGTMNNCNIGQPGVRPDRKHCN